MMPMVAATLVAASSTGIPAAISAPNASSISTSVTGRLIFSADDRSSATRSLMLSSMVRSPAWRISRSGCSSCTRSVTSTSGATSSWSRASWTAMSSAERSGLQPGSDTASTPSRPAASCRISGGRGLGRRLVERPGRRGGDQDVLGVGALEAGLVHHRVGAAGLAEPVVRVGRLLGGDRRSPGPPPRGRRRARRGWRATGGWRSSGRPAAGRRRVGSGQTWRISWVVRTGVDCVFQPRDADPSGQGRQAPGRVDPAPLSAARASARMRAMGTTERRPPEPAAADGVRRLAAAARRCRRSWSSSSWSSAACWRSSWSASLFLLVAGPGCRWIADRHRRMAGRRPRHAVPDQYRPQPSRRASARWPGGRSTR